MPDPIVIAHTADLHFGRRMHGPSRNGESVREHDVYEAGRVVSEWIASELRPDVAVVAGDIWDTPHPTPQAASHGFLFFDRLRDAGIPTLAIGGNHDNLTLPGRPTPLIHLPRHFGVHVALEQDEIELAGVRFCCIPYLALSAGELRPVQHSPSGPDVLVAHAAADADDMPDFAKYDRTRLPRTVLHDPAAPLRLLGHIHIHQQVSPGAYYSGALERLTWGEIVNEPAVYVHRLHPDGTVHTESVRVADMGTPGVPRPAADIAVDGAGLSAEDALDAAVAALDAADLEGRIVRLTVTGAPQDIYSSGVAETLTKRAGARGALSFRPKIVFAPDEAGDAAQARASEDAAPAPGAALSEQFRVFAAGRGEDELAKLGAALIAQASGETAQEAV